MSDHPTDLPKTPLRVGISDEHGGCELLDLTVWTLRRRPENVVDCWDGMTYRRVLPLPTGIVEVAASQVGPPESSRLRVLVTGRPLPARVKATVTSALEQLHGLRIDLFSHASTPACKRGIPPNETVASARSAAPTAPMSDHNPNVNRRS